MVCDVYLFFVTFKYDSHVDAEKREKCKEISASMV